jgi:hypothetical protein
MRRAHWLLEILFTGTTSLGPSYIGQLTTSTIFRKKNNFDDVTMPMLQVVLGTGEDFTLQKAIAFFFCIVNDSSMLCES